MGNLCGKESSPDPFSQPGRTLSSAPAGASTTPKISALPKKVVVGGPPRTLGSASPEPTSTAGGTPAQEDARRKAAAAAEARATANGKKPKGKLGAQLQDQKKQTQGATLDALSKDERRLRDADAGAEARAYN